MHPKKSLGQNFLMHQRIADRIADAAHLSEKDTVLEIGPGTGMLTRALLSRAGRVVAIEADAELIPGLEEEFADALTKGRLTLIHGDIRSFVPEKEPALSGGYALVANIPYYITGEIIRMFLSAKKKPHHMTLLVQKEVAERVARSKKESLLSLSVKAYGEPKYEFTVPRGAFRPAPNVDSAALSINNIREDAFPSTKAETHFFEVLRAGFAHKRKRLAGNLEQLARKEAVIEALLKAGVGMNVRAEDVSRAEWMNIAQLLRY